MSQQGVAPHLILFIGIGVFSLFAQGRYEIDVRDDFGVEATATTTEADPDPNAFIAVEKEPQPLNYEKVRKRIGYPPLAKEAGIQGKVMVQVLVSESGRYKTHIVFRSPHKADAVERELPNLQFLPAIQAGKPVKVWSTTVFDFHLS